MDVGNLPLFSYMNISEVRRSYQVRRSGIQFKFIPVVFREVEVRKGHMRDSTLTLVHRVLMKLALSTGALSC